MGVVGCPRWPCLDQPIPFMWWDVMSMGVAEHPDREATAGEVPRSLPEWPWVIALSRLKLVPHGIAERTLDQPGVDVEACHVTAPADLDDGERDRDGSEQSASSSVAVSRGGVVLPRPAP